MQPTSIRPFWAGVALLAMCLSACGMPQATAPESAPLAAAEAEPELMGGDQPAETLLAEAPAPLPAAEPARRPGWGTMAPISNPGEESRWASGPAPYRVIGPTVPEAEPVRARAAAEAPRRSRSRSRALVRARVEAGPTSWIQVEGASAPAPRARVRHVILPVAQR